MQSTDIKTTSKVIALAQQELIKRNKVAALKSYKGKINLDMDIDWIESLKATALAKLYIHVEKQNHHDP